MLLTFLIKDQNSQIKNGRFTINVGKSSCRCLSPSSSDCLSKFQPNWNKLKVWNCFGESVANFTFFTRKAPEISDECIKTFLCKILFCTEMFQDRKMVMQLTPLALQIHAFFLFPALFYIPRQHLVFWAHTVIFLPAYFDTLTSAWCLDLILSSPCTWSSLSSTISESMKPF